MPEKSELRKLKDTEVDALKGKLLEVRRIGAHPIFVSVTKTDTINDALEKADIPVEDNEIKIEALLDKKNAKWEVVEATTKAYQFSKIVVTTKVAGA